MLNGGEFCLTETFGQRSVVGCRVSLTYTIEQQSTVLAADVTAYAPSTSTAGDTFAAT